MTKKPAKLVPNVLLKRERIRRNWTQKYVAEKVGVQPDTVGQWERGVKSPSLYARSKLCTLFEKSPVELGLYEEIEERSQPPINRPLSPQEQPFPAIWTVPYEQNPFFTGREQVLQHLHRSLGVNETAVFPQTLSGLGGMGKTQIAVEYCYRYRSAYDAVLWVGADSPEEITTHLLQIASGLKLPGSMSKGQQQLLNALREWMRTQPYWLLVLDNLEDLALVKTVVPPARRGHVLVTMRSQLTGTYPKIDVQDLPVDEGALFLLRRANIIAPGDRLESAQETECETARHISRTLGGLPLALDQAGAYLQETGCGLSAYLEQYHARRAELLKYRGEAPTEYPESVATTWSLSFASIQHTQAAAAEVLHAAAFLHPDAIPEELFSHGAKELGPALRALFRHTVPLDQLITTLLKYSLIQRNPAEQTVRVHRLVQAVIMDTMDQQTQRMWAERVVKAVSHQLLTDMASDQPHQRYGSQAQTAVHLVTRWSFPFLEAAHTICAAAKYLYSDGYYAQAETLCLRALRMVQEIPEANATDTYRCLMILVALKIESGDLLEAETWGKQLLVDSETAFGPTHQLTALSLYYLGHILRKRGKDDQAEPLLRRVLTLAQSGSFSQPFPIAAVLIDLASIASHHGRAAEAEALYQDALLANEQVYGSDHPRIADVLTELAMHYASCGQKAQADALRTSALAIYTRVLGTDHPDRANALTGLSLASFFQKRYAQADAYYEQAMAIWARKFRSQRSPRTEPGAVSFEAQESSHSAREMQRFLAILALAAGTEQEEDLATVSSRLAAACLEQGRLSDAQEILWHALDTAENTRGKRDLMTVSCLGNLAQFFQRRKEYAFAGLLYERALQLLIGEFQGKSAVMLPIWQQYLQLLRETGREEWVPKMEHAFEALKKLPDQESR